MGKFIYVFTIAAKDALLEKGYHLLFSDEMDNIFVFVNTATMAEDLRGVIHLESDQLLFQMTSGGDTCGTGHEDPVQE